MPPEHPRYGQGTQAIREAALAIAMDKGLAAVTLRGVADRAGVSHALIRHHFGTRANLIASIIDEATSQTLYLEGAGDSLLSQRIDRTLGQLRIQYANMLSEERQEAVETAYARYTQEVSTWLEGKGITPSPERILLVIATLDGLSMQRLARGSAVDVDGAFAALEALLVGTGSQDPAPRS